MRGSDCDKLKCKLMFSIKNCISSLSNDEPYTADYLCTVLSSLQYNLWGPAIIYCAIALEAHLREKLKVDCPVETNELLSCSLEHSVINQEQKRIVECIIALRNSHAHPYQWLFQRTKDKLKNCADLFGQEPPDWLKDLTKQGNPSTNKKFINLYDENTALLVAEHTIRIICPSFSQQLGVEQ